MKIEVKRDICIGAAPCVAVAPGVFQLDDEGKAYIVDPKGADEATIKLAAEACPVRAIFLYDDSGKQIYPPVETTAQMPAPATPANDNANPPAQKAA
ncbi:MAG TPA: ferredoxin [Candidatus Gracilibacteria bacterium]|nr:ferredoxin [Candidatus Gracilibacteria bacterium]HRY90831.1 ferredoxin [Candidatus Gracilibacteria bacterium]